MHKPNTYTEDDTKLIEMNLSFILSKLVSQNYSWYKLLIVRRFVPGSTCNLVHLNRLFGFFSSR